MAVLGCERIPRRRTPVPTPIPFIGADVAALQVGQNVRVRMRIECTEGGALTEPVYLMPTCYYQGFFFRLVIPPAKRDAFQLLIRGEPQELLVDKVVDATGVVQKSGIWSEIVLEAPDQLRVATGWAVGYIPTRVPTPVAPSPTP